MRATGSVLVSLAAFLLLIAITTGWDIWAWLALAVSLTGLALQLLSNLYVPGKSDPLD
jgi:hypothetical protein